MKAIQWAGRHAWLGWLLCLPIFWQGGAWAFDRSPPFAISGPLVVRDAPPGGTVRIVAAVRRDISRSCSVRFSRHIVDGSGMRHDFAADPRVMTADGLAAMDEAMSGQIRLAIEIPRGAAPGAALYASDLFYICNPLHRLWPIEVSMLLPFKIEAP